MYFSHGIVVAQIGPIQDSLVFTGRQDNMQQLADVFLVGATFIVRGMPVLRRESDACLSATSRIPCCCCSAELVSVRLSLQLENCGRAER